MHKPAYTPGRWDFGSWRGIDGLPVGAIAGDDDPAWPEELQDPKHQTRPGTGSLGSGDIADPHAGHKRTDFKDLREFALDEPGALPDLARCYQHRIAVRRRRLPGRHPQARQFRAGPSVLRRDQGFAANVGKDNFFLVGEIAGGDYGAERYPSALGQNLSAALDIGEMRPTLTAVAKGLAAPSAYFDGFDAARAVLGSHRNYGDHHVSILDDHDHVSGEKIRFSAGAASPHQTFAGVAIQLLPLGTPCLYYGTEQGFAGPAVRVALAPGVGPDRSLPAGGDVRPRASTPCRARGARPRAGRRRPGLAGFGPFGTAGRHWFDPAHPLYRRIAALAAVRREYPVLRADGSYLRPTSLFGGPFALPSAGELAGWSRILTDEEALCVVNPHGTSARGADVLVGAQLNVPGGSLEVVFNSAEASGAAPGPHATGSAVPVRFRDATAYVELCYFAPSEVLVLVNRPD